MAFFFSPAAYLRTLYFSFVSSAGEPRFFFFFFFPRSSFQNKNTLLNSHLIAMSDFRVPALLQRVNGEFDTGKLCKGKFPFGFVQL